MAPYNLTDLAVKELKVPVSHLSPPKEKNYNFHFLMGLFIDFWALFWITSFSTLFFKTAVLTLMSSAQLEKAWEHIDFSPMMIFGWGALAFTYFFTSFYLNQGQTPGMKYTKCRVSMQPYHARSALRWTIFSLSLYLSCGFSFFTGVRWLSSTGRITSHDHLWHDLMKQKEEAAPELMSLIEEDRFISVAEAA